MTLMDELLNIYIALLLACGFIFLLVITLFLFFILLAGFFAIQFGEDE